MMLPTGRFAVIYADPPWQFRSWSDKGRNRCPDALVRQKGLAERHYKVMSARGHPRTAGPGARAPGLRALPMGSELQSQGGDSRRGVVGLRVQDHRVRLEQDSPGRESARP